MIRAVCIVLTAVLWCWTSMAAGGDRQDRLLADFEGDSYGDWKVEGQAFGQGPAAGTLPGQMPVSGFEGKRLVNSFVGGDGSTGLLTSPDFTIDRKRIHFLIGGGAHSGQTCMNLLVEGKVVRTAAGPNNSPGGSEQLDWTSWDVAELEGKKAVLVIVDRHTGGWGHINIDQIVLSDTPLTTGPAERTLEVAARYLHLPVKTGGVMRRMRILLDGAPVREFDIELAEGEPDFWTFADLSAFAGKKLTLSVDRLRLPSLLDSLPLADQLPQGAGDYAEPSRPQFHFTSRRGWLNDPNGLVFADGEYHLFYQHNPYGWNWGNMHWGHAVSRDLVHWRELPEALYPRQYGDWCFSGSAIHDAGDVLGLGKKGGASGGAIAAFFTSTGRGECLVFSQDGGRTWTEYEGNPVVRHKGRDPKVIWHDGTNQWCMAVYDEEQGQQIAFYSSPDLKNWRLESRIDGFFECPDLFALPVDGDQKQMLWVLYAADGKYVLGQFDGKTFRPQTPKFELWRGDFYAAQTFSDLPGGRRVQIGWGRGIAFPGQPFNQQMTVACELSLRSTGDGPRMFALPVAELSALRKPALELRDATIAAGGNLLEELRGELWDVEAEFELDAGAAVRLELLGGQVVYDAAKGELRCQDVVAPLALDDGLLKLRILVDKGSLEVFAGGGRVAISKGFTPAASTPPLRMTADGGKVVARKLDVHGVRSIWREEAP